jgi:hypothetical protein
MVLIQINPRVEIEEIAMMDDIPKYIFINQVIIISLGAQTVFDKGKYCGYQEPQNDQQLGPKCPKLLY